MKTIKLFEPIITDKHRDALVNAFYNEKFIDGESTRKFKVMLQTKFGRKYCALCNSGTSALILALRGATIRGLIPRHSEIYTTPLSFISTTSAITLSNHKPKFCDVDRCGLMKPPFNKGVFLPVALYGKRYSYINDLNGVVIEDDAQAHGTHNLNALANCFSFYTTKNLNVGGYGGAILTDDEKLFETVESLINNGRIRGQSYTHQYLSSSYRINNINAAIGIINLKLLHDQTAQRRFLAASYNSALKDVEFVDLITEPVHNHTFHLYVIRVSPLIRDELRKHLKSLGIQTGIHYPILIPNQPVYSRMKKVYVPNAEYMAQEIISLPMHNKLKFDDVYYITNCIRKFFGYDEI